MSGLKFELITKGYYIECRLNENFTHKNTEKLSGELLELSKKSGIKRVLLDAKELDPAAYYGAIRNGFGHFQKISKDMDVIASYVPGNKLYSVTKIFSPVFRIQHHRIFSTKDAAVSYLNHHISAPAPSPAHEIFRYHLSLQKNFIFCQVSGTPNNEGIVLVSNELLALAKQSGIKKLFIDASRIKPFYSILGHGIKYFKLITDRIDRGASYIPDKKIYALGRFIELVSGAKNWKTFKKKEDALTWLLKKRSGTSTGR